MKSRITNLNQALTYQLEGMYDAEKKLMKYLPACMKRTPSRALKGELKGYIESARDKRIKLKRIFSYLLTGPYGRKNKVMDSQIGDIKDMQKLVSTPELQDAMLLSSIQNICHSKIAAYGTAKAWAEELDIKPVVNLLNEVLEWEKESNAAMTAIAQKGVSKKAI